MATCVSMLAVMSMGPLASAEVPAASGGLDGMHLALGAVGSAVRSPGGSWDSGFGAELLLVHVREQDALGAVGLGLGGMRLSEAGTGRLWADLQLGTRQLLDLPAGLSIGASVEVDRVIPPRWGAQATLSAFVGVVPFLRIGAAQNSGTYLDLGIKVALPVLRM